MVDEGCESSPFQGYIPEATHSLLQGKIGRTNVLKTVTSGGTLSPNGLRRYLRECKVAGPQMSNYHGHDMNRYKIGSNHQERRFSRHESDTYTRTYRIQLLWIGSTSDTTDFE